ncbi:DUF4145 domain-containing protein [Priestia aryabhattai]|uniref:DUF4145 domain-containing protein n=1 Tax=Priestia aryabhattai TaxID=412384 RepID=A0AAX6NI22_PRIAR|nr:DUF4145 domain-containing protein [Priestia aryabhattai]MDU9695551.1 DUF4145 domain-containing protein [Priestia aryabhattai]
MNKVDKKIYCSSCDKNTNHMFLADKQGNKLEHKISDVDVEEDMGLSFSDEYYIVQCMGCDKVAFLNIYGDETMFYIVGKDQWADREYIQDYNVYPPEPEKEDVVLKSLKYVSQYEFCHLPEFIEVLRNEVIFAYREKAKLLCGMGLRMIVEAVCKEKGITEQPRLKKGNPLLDEDGKVIMRNLKLYEKIEILKERNIIDEPQKNVLHQVRDLGNDTAHEIKPHNLLLLRQALNVVDFILYNIYEMPNVNIGIKKTNT